MLDSFVHEWFLEQKRSGRNLPPPQKNLLCGVCTLKLQMLILIELEQLEKTFSQQNLYPWSFYYKTRVTWNHVYETTFSFYYVGVGITTGIRSTQ